MDLTTMWFYIFPIISILSIILSSDVSAVTPTSLFTTSCVPGSQQTSFPNCNNFNNYATCADKSTDQEWKSCLCNQDYLNSLFGCESEMRLCFESDRLDTTYEEALSLWHSLCNTFTTFSASTPPVSVVSASYDIFCGDNGVQSACTTASLLFDQCTSSFSSNNARFTSCLCQPRFLSLDYSCEYLGNTSCLGIPATAPNMVGYPCPNFAEIIGTGIASQSVVTVSLPNTITGPIVTPAPSSTIGTPIATATSTSKSTSNRVCLRNGLYRNIWPFQLLLLGLLWL